MGKSTVVSRTPERVREYNQNYYQRNRERLTAQKNSKYRNDPEYRQKALDRAKKQSADKKKTRVRGVFRYYNDKKLLMYKIGMVAKDLGVDTFHIITWEFKGLIPKHLPVGTSRVYTGEQVQLIALAVKEMEKHDNIVKAIADVSAHIKQNWMNGVE